MEEQYASLQDEAVGKTKKLAKINQMYKSAKAEVGFQRVCLMTYPSIKS